jgi:hypothetical protein
MIGGAESSRQVFFASRTTVAATVIGYGRDASARG